MTVDVYRKRLKRTSDKVFVYNMDERAENEPIRKVSLYKEKEIPYLTTALTIPGKIAELMYNLFEINLLADEYVYMLAFNAKCDLLGIVEVSHRGIQSSFLSPRDVFQNALLFNASGVVIVHNHPSGYCTPSDSDLTVKERLKQAGMLLGIDLMDFIILGRNEYYSAAERNEL